VIYSGTFRFFTRKLLDHLLRRFSVACPRLLCVGVDEFFGDDDTDGFLDDFKIEV